MSVLEGRDAFLRTIEQLTAEREAARPIIQNLPATLSEVWEREIPSSWRTAGFVQELTAAAAANLESNPRESLALSQLALAIVTSIPAETYAAPIQAQLQGAVWKEIGTAHRYLSEYDAALRAFDVAQRALQSESALAHDDAIVDFARAIVLTDLGRHDEALELLTQTEPVFRGFEDQRRLVQVRVLSGIILQRQGQLQKARATYEQALEETQLEDLHTRAVLYNNLGQVCADLGDTAQAVLVLHNALRLFGELKMPVEVTRTEWTLARVLLLTGDFSKAVPILRRARDMFLATRMPEEAGLAGLDLVDALLATSQADEARSVIERVLAEFREANLNARAVTALAYLRDVLPTTRQPQRVVHHVRGYLEQLRSEPARLFLPLSEE